MKYSRAPVVRVSVEPRNPADLPRLLQGLKKLAKFDPTAKIPYEENGQHIISSCSENHIELCLNDLQTTYARCEIKSSDLFAIYRETVTTTSSQVCLAKTPNRHNKLYVAAEPLSDKLTDLIDSGKLRLNDDVKERQKILCGDFGWDASDTQKIWSFGPDNQGSNTLADVTEGVQYLNEIRDNMNSTFQWVTKEGVLAGENLRSVRMNLVDAVMHSDAIHRGAGQIMLTARRAFFAAELQLNQEYRNQSS